MRKLLTVVCILSFATALAACGSSGGSDSAKDETTTTKAEGAKTTTTADDTTETTKAGSGGGSEEEYLAALQTNLTSGSTADGNLVIADGEAQCVAPKWMDAITADGFGEATPDEVSDPGFDFGTLGLDAEQAQAVIDAFEPCGVDIYGKLAESLTIGLTTDQQACAMEKVDPDLANALLVTAFHDDGSSSQAFSDLLDQLQSVCDLPADGPGN